MYHAVICRRVELFWTCLSRKRKERWVRGGAPRSCAPNVCSLLQRTLPVFQRSNGAVSFSYKALIKHVTFCSQLIEGSWKKKKKRSTWHICEIYAWLARKCQLISILQHRCPSRLRYIPKLSSPQQRVFTIAYRQVDKKQRPSFVEVKHRWQLAPNVPFSISSLNYSHFVYTCRKTRNISSASNIPIWITAYVSRLVQF